MDVDKISQRQPLLRAQRYQLPSGESRHVSAQVGTERGVGLACHVASRGQCEEGLRRVIKGGMKGGGRACDVSSRAV